MVKLRCNICGGSGYIYTNKYDWQRKTICKICNKKGFLYF